MAIIELNKLERTYTSYKRGHGLKEAFKALFKRELVFSYAVKKISFSVEEGEIVGFVGPNGAGKSTTIKMLTGILYPTGGHVSVMGLVPWKQRKEYVWHIGVVFGQKSQLWWDLPPADAFYLMKGIYNIPEELFKTKLAEMVKMLRLEEIMQRPTRDLSLGERMKCEFVMALLHNPKILFLDEPTIGVDAIAKEEIRAFLKEINRKYKTTILLTTHDMDDIEQVCERIIIIDHGCIIYDGNLAEVKKKYTKRKTIEFEVVKITDKRKYNALMKKVTIIESRNNYRSVHVENKVASQVLKGLMDCCDIADLLVHEPELEDVIKEIYRGQ